MPNDKGVSRPVSPLRSAAVENGGAKLNDEFVEEKLTEPSRASSLSTHQTMKKMAAADRWNYGFR